MLLHLTLLAHVRCDVMLFVLSVAPYHPRLDHFTFYHSVGADGHGLLANVGVNRPYGATRATSYMRIAQCLLQGSDNPTYGLFDDSRNPFPDPTAPPKWVRVSLYQFKPRPAGEAWRTGRWWTETRAGTHTAPMTLASCERVWADWPNPTHLWGPEAVHWRRWASPVAGMTDTEYALAWACLGRIQRTAWEVAKELGLTLRPAPSTEGNSAVVVSLDAAAEWFTWRTLPETMRRVRKDLGESDWRRAEEAIGKCTMSLVAQLETVLLRQTPTRAQLQQELGAAVAEQAGGSGRRQSMDGFDWRGVYSRLGK